MGSIGELPADWAVVGLGGAGSAVAASLAAEGFRVSAVEQFSLNHNRGSSHGGTRILRTAYSEGVRYVPLVLRARQLWLDLGRNEGTPLFSTTGALVVGPRSGRIVDGAVKSAVEARLPHRLLSSREVTERFPAFRLDPAEVALWDPQGGVVFPELALSVFVERARRAGARFQWHTRASAWTASRTGVRIRTSKGPVQANGLILSCGPWTGTMTRGLRLPLSIERQSVFWYRPDRRAGSRFKTMPAFVWQREGTGYFYGTPDFGEGLKVASDLGRKVRDPYRRARGQASRERARVEQFLDSRMPRARGRRVRRMDCLYTNASDHNFVLDFHPRHSNVIVVSACSGHGFKFVPAVGEAVAHMATTGRLERGWAWLGMSRWPWIRKMRTL